MINSLLSKHIAHGSKLKVFYKASYMDHIISVKFLMAMNYAKVLTIDVVFEFQITLEERKEKL